MIILNVIKINWVSNNVISDQSFKVLTAFVPIIWSSFHLSVESNSVVALVLHCYMYAL